MNKLILVAGLAASICGPSPAAAQGAASPWNWWRSKPAVQPVQAQTAIVKFSGRLTVSRAPADMTTPVRKAPFLLQAGDTVRTSGDGSAVLRLQDSSEIRLDPGSEFVLRQESPAGVSLILNIGKLWAQVAKGRTRSFEVRTPSAVAAVRGTSFSVEVTAARNAITEVYEGAVAVAALNKKNARVGPEALLLAGQRVEASGGRLGETRAIVKPANPQAHEPVPKQKAELEKKLKTLTAEAEARHDADASAAASAALHSGDSSRMSAVVAALKSAQDMSQEQRSLLVKAFDKGRSLNDFDSSSVQADSSEMRRRQMSRAMANWNVNRELGFQFHDQASRSLMAKGALSASASQASAQVAMAAYQQQYTQSYLSSQETLTQALRPTLMSNSGALTGATLSAANLSAATLAAAPSGVAAMQLSAQPAMALQLAGSATLTQATLTAANAVNLNGTTIGSGATTGSGATLGSGTAIVSGGCTCVQTVCSCR